MWTKVLALAVLGATVAGCTTARTILLPSYVLDNGQRLQDVVTVGGDRTGDAPSLTVVKTFDVSTAGHTALVSHDTASAPSVGTVIAGGIAGAIPHAAAAVGIAAINNNKRPTISANITTNVKNANESNSAANGNTNAVDNVATSAATNDNINSASAAAANENNNVASSDNNSVISPSITNVAASASDNNSVVSPDITNVAASSSDNNSDLTNLSINDLTNESTNIQDQEANQVVDVDQTVDQTVNPAP